MRSRRPTPKHTSEWVAETRLIDRINAGEESAFRQLMQRYNQSLYRVARHPAWHQAGVERTEAQSGHPVNRSAYQAGEEWHNRECALLLAGCCDVTPYV